MCNSGIYNNKKPKQTINLTGPIWQQMARIQNTFVLGKDSYNVHKNHKNLK